MGPTKSLTNLVPGTGRRVAMSGKAYDHGRKKFFVGGCKLRDTLISSNSFGEIAT